MTNGAARAAPAIMQLNSEPILTPDETAALCERCGRCCIIPMDIVRGFAAYLGGTPATHHALKGASGECRYLSLAHTDGTRECIMYDSPRRPALCLNSPTASNLYYLPDCPVTRAAKERLKCLDG